MNDQQTKETIMDMVQGGFNDVINDKVSEILMNILDLNTDLKARELNIKIKLTPLDVRRKTVTVTFNSQVKNRPINPISTTIMIGNDAEGRMQAKELMSEVEGQLYLTGGEVPSPKIITFNNKKEREQTAQIG